MEEKSNYERYEAIRRKTDDEYESVISAFGISKGAMMIIFTLYSFGRPCTQKEICEDWYENKQTINSAAKKLAEEGIIDRPPDSGIGIFFGFGQLDKLGYACSIAA